MEKMRVGGVGVIWAGQNEGKLDADVDNDVVVEKALTLFLT